MKNIINKYNKHLKVDRYLYHATIYSYFNEIVNAGFIGKSPHKNYDISNKSFVCMSNDKNTALAFVTTFSNNIKACDKKEPVILKIDSSLLNLSNIDYDKNVTIIDYNKRRHRHTRCFQYTSTIPLEAIVKIIL